MKHDIVLELAGMARLRGSLSVASPFDLLLRLSPPDGSADIARNQLWQVLRGGAAGAFGAPT